MAVRVPVVIVYEKSKILASAILNAGYETKKPEILAPTKLLKLNQIRKTNPLAYKTAGGTAIHYSLGKAKIKVKCQDKESKDVAADLLISDLLDEILISDKLISELGIILLDPGKGYWRFKDDPPNKIRRSVK